jgi:hypothetical protein
MILPAAGAGAAAERRDAAPEGLVQFDTADLSSPLDVPAFLRRQT